MFNILLAKLCPLTVYGEIEHLPVGAASRVPRATTPGVSQGVLGGISGALLSGAW